VEAVLYKVAYRSDDGHKLTAKRFNGIVACIEQCIASCRTDILRAEHFSG
jgi:hypothetical protein